MANLRGWEIIALVVIVLLLFGSKKLPDAARGIGRSLRIFKAETKGLMDEDKAGASGQEVAASPETPEIPPTTAKDPVASAPPAEPVEQQQQPPSGRTNA
ncbi:MAG: Sec-independent protein translocase subunit TatA [Actinobacteria bacterium]|nr:Sec-independent protein translocase subunit TatA [Actinomycetota bacterium]MCB9412533.1 Sec-independent protein translocase subunit TatA [Actinomycetota bacterium]